MNDQLKIRSTLSLSSHELIDFSCIDMSDYVDHPYGTSWQLLNPLLEVIERPVMAITQYGTGKNTVQRIALVEYGGEGSTEANVLFFCQHSLRSKLPCNEQKDFEANIDHYRQYEISQEVLDLATKLRNERKAHKSTKEREERHRKTLMEVASDLSSAIKL